MDEELKPGQSGDLLRWEMVFEILSVERAEPFLKEMGLTLPDVAGVRSIARQFLVNLERVRGEREREEAQVASAFAKVAESLGPQVAEHLHRWGRTTFPLGKERGFFRWLFLLWWLAGIGGREYPPPPPQIDASKVAEIIRVVRESFGDHLVLDERLEKAERMPKSSWEEKIYQRAEEGYSPLMTVREMIEYHRFQRMWGTIDAALTDKENEALLEWAKERAPELDLRPDSLELPR